MDCTGAGPALQRQVRGDKLCLPERLAGIVVFPNVTRVVCSLDPLDLLCDCSLSSLDPCIL